MILDSYKEKVRNLYEEAARALWTKSHSGTSEWGAILLGFPFGLFVCLVFFAFLVALVAGLILAVALKLPFLLLGLVFVPHWVAIAYFRMQIAVQEAVDKKFEEDHTAKEEV